MNADEANAALDSVGRPVMVASYYRSGTHLLMDLVRRHFPEFRPRMRPFESIHSTYLSLDRFESTAHRPISPSASIALLAKASRPTIKTHALPSFERLRESTRVFCQQLVDRAVTLYAVRDGRDVMCSKHAWELAYRDGAEPDFDRFCFTPRPWGVNCPVHDWNEHVLTWLDRPGMIAVRFERVIRDTEAVIGELAEALQSEPQIRHPLLPKPIKSVRASWIARALGRLESTNVHSKDIRPFKRAEAFDGALTDRFFEMAGEAMTRLGYGR
ncbi:MAG: sulfotransferase domain-containing protein [Planctomycetota bacterium]